MNEKLVDLYYIKFSYKSRNKTIKGKACFRLPVVCNKFVFSDIFEKQISEDLSNITVNLPCGFLYLFSYSLSYERSKTTLRGILSVEFEFKLLESSINEKQKDKSSFIKSNRKEIKIKISEKLTEAISKSFTNLKNIYRYINFMVPKVKNEVDPYHIVFR